MRILIVEDASFLSEMVKETLTRAGHQVVAIAEDGLQAVQHAKYYTPDLILMDLVLPLLSGIEATKKILEDNPDIKIIAFSTLDDEAIIEKAIEAGCSNFISKPFKKKDLMTLLERSGATL